jgi:hypothetical protein
MRRRTSQLRLQQIGAVATAYHGKGAAARPAHDPEKAAPHLMRGVQRLSEKIMLNQ